MIHNATLKRVVDGDTYEMTISLGFNVSIDIVVRLWGINCPEMKSGGEDAKLFAEKILSTSKIMIIAYEPDSFGRWVCDVLLKGGDYNSKFLTEMMLDAKMGVPYYPQKKDKKDRDDARKENNF